MRHEASRVVRPSSHGCSYSVLHYIGICVTLFWNLCYTVLEAVLHCFGVCVILLCRLGAVARKHGSYASCVRMTNTLYGFNAMEVQEAFVKIREQVNRASQWAVTKFEPS